MVSFVTVFVNIPWFAHIIVESKAWRGIMHIDLYVSEISCHTPVTLGDESALSLKRDNLLNKWNDIFYLKSRKVMLYRPKKSKSSSFSFIWNQEDKRYSEDSTSFKLRSQSTQYTREFLLQNLFFKLRVHEELWFLLLQYSG